MKKFYGQSKNAVETQIWIALIVYVLYLKLRQMSSGEGKNFTDFISELKVYLFEWKDLFGWFAGLSSVIDNPDASVGVCCSHKVVAVGFNTLRYDASVGVLNLPHE